MKKSSFPARPYILTYWETAELPAEFFQPGTDKLLLGIKILSIENRRCRVQVGARIRIFPVRAPRDCDFPAPAPAHVPSPEAGAFLAGLISATKAQTA